MTLIKDGRGGGGGGRAGVEKGVSRGVGDEGLQASCFWVTL